MSTTLSFRILIALLAASIAATAADFKRDIIYQIVTDRFFDGDSTNNNPPQSSGLFDSTKTNFQAYWGGDLAGIQQKMSYIAGMGVTAIWISPPIILTTLTPGSLARSTITGAWWETTRTTPTATFTTIQTSATSTTDIR